MSTPAPARHSWGDKHSTRFDFLAGGGELGELIRRHDWAATPLGPPESWSQSLKMMVSLMLANRFPLLLWWGPQYVQLYNDPYRPVLGTKHPASLGQSCSECWCEIWQVLKPLIDTPFQGGSPTWMEDFELEIHRHGFTEESHFTIAYSPVPDETASHGIGGVLATVHEITEKVVSERRIAELRELGSCFATAKTEEETCFAAAEMLGKCSKDVPFALIYLIDGEGKVARRAGVTGFPVLEAAGPSMVLLAEDIRQDCPWPIAEVARTGTSTSVTGLAGRLTHVPPGPWSDPPDSAVVLPIRSNKAERLAGVLVAGVSARLKLNEHYSGFFELAAAQIATAVANARAYEEERRRAEALAAIDRVKTTFFSNVSHEFRTPLTLMLGPLEEAGAHAATPEPVRKQVDLAYRNSLRLLRLVNSLLDFSRIEAGRVKASYEPTDLATITRNLCSTFHSAMERAGLIFTVACEPLDESVYVDQDMWEKIVLNLLSNAFKFTLQGTVTVRLRRAGTQALLEVCDTGVGIPEHELPRLFERFHRVEGTLGRTQEGSGIGLALVQELVKLHAGTIETTSQLGKGTRFEVKIPFGAAHLPAEQVKAPRSGESTAIGARAFVEEALRWIPGGGSDGASAAASAEHVMTASAGPYAKTVGRRVLVADDNADMRSYVHDLLAPIYAVETVYDGEKALEAARREHPDLILSDIMMPRLNGMALLQAVRADESLRDVPVILLSARAGEEARVEGLRAGADDYLVKPFSARELVARVGARIELTSMRRENDARFRAFVSATSDVVYQMSPDWSELRHLQGRNFIADTTDPSRTWLDRYIHPDDQAQLVAAIGEAIRSRKTFQLEHRVRRLDGTLGWMLSRAVPLEDEQGDILEWFGTASDVTERKRSQALSECQRQALQRLAEGGSLETVLGFLIESIQQQTPADLLGSILLLNEAGTHFERGIAPSLPAAFTEAMRGIAVESMTGICCYAVAQRQAVAMGDFNADPHWARVADFMAPYGLRAGWSTPIVGSGGRLLGAFANYYRQPGDPCPRDLKWVEIVTRTAAIAIERRQSEARLREEKRVQELLGKVSQSLVAAQLDVERVVQIATDAATELSGAAFGAFFYSVQDERGEGHTLYALSGAPRAAFERFPHPRHTAVFGPTFRGEALVRSDDITADPRYAHNPPYFGLPTGHLPVRSYLAVPVKTAAGKVLGGLFFGHPEVAVFDERSERLVLALAAQAAVAFDNANLHQASRREIEQRKQAEEALSEADRRKDEFLAMLAHELRNPLAPIGNASEFLAKVLAGDARTQSAVEMIKRQTMQLTRLVDDLLDVSRITQGRIQLSRQPIEVAAVIAQAVETVEPLLRAKQHRLSIVSSYETLHVDGDFTRLVQCVGNILTNAIKYTEPRGEIRVQTRSEVGVVVIEVADNGAGIPERLLPRVFDLFVQSDRTLDRAQGGLGVGLAVVKRLVQMHGGEVSVRSAGEGLGSTFEIRLPQIARPQVAATAAAAPETPRRRLLIVDDNSDAADSLALLLSLQGHETDVTYSAKDALDRIERFRPDLALLDLGLPGIDGYELAKTIRALPGLPNIRLIAVSGYGQAEDRRRTQAAGFDDHLVKPVDLAILERALAGLSQG